MKTCLLVDDHEINQAVAAQLGFSPQHGYVGAAKRLLMDCWYTKKKPAVVANTQDDLREVYAPDVRNHIPLDITWARSLSPAMIGRWVHAYDKNSQHLSAEQSVYTGYGEPIHVYDGDDETCIKPALPGLYRVSWHTNGSRFDGRLYPTIFDEGDQYATLDVVKFAIQQGYDVWIKEAWLFENHTRVFEDYARRLWNARQSLREVNPAAAHEVNEIAHVTGCWVSSKAKKLPATSRRLDMIHPNWWADIVGCARARLLANLLAYGPAVCIRTDALYYVSSEADINQAIRHAKTGESITARSSECGGFKVQPGWRSFQLTQEIYEQAEQLSLGDSAALSSLFKQYGGVR